MNITTTTQPTITFRTLNAFCVFASMAEGMAEVHQDNDDDEGRAMAAAIHTMMADLGAQLEASGAAINSAVYPVTFTLADAVLEAARGILENCIDNASGAGIEDENAEDFIFDGDVELSV